MLGVRNLNIYYSKFKFTLYHLGYTVHLKVKELTFTHQYLKKNPNNESAPLYRKMKMFPYSIDPLLEQ